MSKVLYVILNGSLNMTAGKAAAQTAHAVAMLPTIHTESFVQDYRRTVIVLSANGREQMDGIVDYLYDAGIVCEAYTDEGVNEVDAFSMTAIAVEPIEEDDERTRAIFSGLNLYKGGNNHYQRAYNELNDLRWTLQNGFEDNTPWYVKLTIKWLRKNK